VSRKNIVKKIHSNGEPGSFYVMDRGYLDFERLYLLHQCMALFVIRSKSTTKMRRPYSHGIDKTTGLRSDQTVVLKGYQLKETPAASNAFFGAEKTGYRP
jgi:hypothetical protein